MPTPFAALETRVNAAAFGKLANATAVIAGQSVDGIFSQAYIEQMGAEGMRPTFTVKDADLPVVSHTTLATIGGVNYRIVGIQPDAGVKVLVLELQ